MSWWLGTYIQTKTGLMVLHGNLGKGAKNCCHGLNQCLVKLSFETDWKHTDKESKTITGSNHESIDSSVTSVNNT